MEFLRHHVRGFLFFNAVKAAAMNHPYLLLGLCDRFYAFSLLLKFHEPSIEPGEEIGCADPQNAGENMHPAENQLCPFVQVKVHGIKSSGRFMPPSCGKGFRHSSLKFQSQLKKWVLSA